MATNDEQYYISECLRAIEDRLNWGNPASWSNYDFVKLAGLIATETGVQLSVSTLKRIWGKVAYQHAPSLTTLNALARYLGYADWRIFQQQYRATPPAAPVGQPATPLDKPAAQVATTAAPASFTSAPPPFPASRSRRPQLLYGIAGLLVVLGVIAFMAVKKKAAPDPSDFRFAANKVVSEGVPNSVVFTYDATAATTDSVYIVQTWDIRRKTLVPRNKHEHSAIYYYPGFFRTRLIVDGHTVQRHDLMISTNGWLCLAEQDPVPLYFKKEEYARGDRIEVDTAVLKNYQLPLYPRAPKIRFFNQRDLGKLQNDNFTFETKLKNEFTSGTGACQFVQVLIQCKNDIIIIPLAAKPCTGEATLVAAGAEVNSKDADLSGFGADLSQWTTLRVESRHKTMRFLVNGSLAHTLTFPNDPTGIVGLQYRFSGLGAVKDTWFRDGEHLYDFAPGGVRITKL